MRRTFPTWKPPAASPRACSASSAIRRRAVDDKERYAAGMQVRRAVLGDAHVDRTLKNKNAFNEEYQDLITRYAWGEIWTRPGPPQHPRSLHTRGRPAPPNRDAELPDARSADDDE